MRWYSTELPKATAGLFKEYCRDMGITYEASECGNLIHFEVFMDETEKAMADNFIERRC